MLSGLESKARRGKGTRNKDLNGRTWSERGVSGEFKASDVVIQTTTMSRSWWQKWEAGTSFPGVCLPQDDNRTQGKEKD